MSWLLLVLSLLALTCGASPTGRPNVLLIVIDTIRADRLSCYGSKTVQTPHMDKLAAQAVLFENAFTQAAYTLPSVCTMLTSLYPYKHRVRANDTNLDDQFTTLPEILRAAGFRTGAVLGSAVLHRERNVSQGFEYYDDQFPATLPVYDPALRRADVGLGSELQRRAEDVTDLSLDWIRRNKEKPFFLLAHYFDPHSLYDPPPPFRDRHPGRPYDGEVAYTDREVGRLLDGLEQIGAADNTLIVLVGDHGESLGDHGEPEHGFFVYDQTIHIPLIMKFPGELPAGRQVPQLVRTMDIFPTILELLELPQREPSDGRSLIPLFRGGDFPEVPVYSEAFSGYFSYGWSPTRSIRTVEWKYVEAPEKELYDLLSDPLEETNLYETEQVVASRLEERMRTHLREEALVEPWELEAGEISPEQRERLEALGYLSRDGRKAWDAFGNLPDPKTEVALFQKRQESKYLTFLATSYLNEQNTRKAEELFQKALDLTPSHLPAMNGIASIRMRSGGFAEAEMIYRKILEHDSSNVEVCVDLSIALTNQGRIPEAIEALETGPEGLPRDPRYQQVLAALKQAHAQGRPLVIR